MRIKSLCFVLLLFQLSCIEEFTPSIDEHISALVVEGEITNELKPVVVKLSLSSGVNEPELIPVEAAEVIITDNEGNENILNEIEPGLYSTWENNIKGIIGRKYRVIINYKSKTYQSDFEELKEPFQIDSVYSKIEEKGRLNGLQFYVDTEVYDANEYLLWKLNETYKYNADDYPLAFIYHSSDNIEIAEPDAIYTCWRTTNLFEFFTTKTENMGTGKLTGFQLNYVDNETKRLLIKYSLLISQYTISEVAYDYWTKMKELNDESGSLYSKQPYLVKGNVYNSDNLDEIVLGYFSVAGIAEKRIFVEKPNIEFNLDLCKATHIDYIRWTRRSPPTYPIYIKLVEGELGKAGLGCFDCRMEGGVTEEPDFWID